MVGGGYSGMSAALRLRELGVDVALVEGGFCGWGASSRNAGHLTPTIVGDPQLLATVMRRRAPQLLGFAEAATRSTEAMIGRLGIDCEYEPVGNVSSALSRGQLQRSRRVAEFLEGAGGEVEFVDAAEHGLPTGFLGGVLERAGGILNPGLFARGLRERIVDADAKVFEASPVGAVDSLGGAFQLRTPYGSLRAEQVIVATNGYARDQDFVPARVVKPVWVTMVETEPIEPEALADLGWSSRSGIYTQHILLESYRLTKRNTIAFGTRQVKPAGRSLGARTPDAAVVGEVVRGFRQRFPSLDRLEMANCWGGFVAMTPSWIPAAGRTRQGVHYILGFNGHGVAQAPYTGTAMADLIHSGERGPLELIWRERESFPPAPLFSGPALDLGWGLDRLTDRLTGNQ